MKTFTAKKKLILLLVVLIPLYLFSACSEKGEYVSITAQEAKELMDTESDYIILDVRTQEEFDEGHIPGATLIPDTNISKLAPILLKDKEKLIFVYCRTGRRSKNASAELAEMGYTNIKEFGGIVDWPFEIE